MEQLEANGLLGVTFTADEFESVRQWVQDRADSEIVATPLRLYLPVASAGMVQVDQDDVIWWDPEGGVNAFSLDRH